MTTSLSCQRLAVGWLFLYEVLAKHLTPAGTSAPCLEASYGICSGLFHCLASSPGLVRVVDLWNIWGVILIGLALILGCSSRLATASGIVLLALYYLAQPPMIQTDYGIPEEGHHLLVNKSVVELAVLTIFVALPSGTLWGLDRLLRHWRAEGAAIPEAELLVEKAPDASPMVDDRER
jgi:thiosulfate dehydrogenase [quinone] large subunit